MNLTEALNTALPEIPLHARPRGKPCLHPDVVWRQHMQEGEPIIMCIVPGTGVVFRFSEIQWALVQLCDGERSYEQLSEAALEQLGINFPSEDIETYCNELDESGFWYKSPQEKTFLLNEKLKTERQKHLRRKSKVGDLSMIFVGWWDPDAYLSWLHSNTGFLFSNWFTAVVLCAFVFMAYIFFQG
ncbi:MAG: hypothetical protein JO187_03720, partial [Acidobacteria bacterium]|nr:hypothetical protein [Acidobacteriota bacterium]